MAQSALGKYSFPKTEPVVEQVQDATPVQTKAAPLVWDKLVFRLPAGLFGILVDRAGYTPFSLSRRSHSPSVLSCFPGARRLRLPARSHYHLMPDIETTGRGAWIVVRHHERAGR